MTKNIIPLTEIKEAKELKNYSGLNGLLRKGGSSYQFTPQYQDTPNHLKTPIGFWQRYLLEPMFRLGYRIKVAAKVILVLLAAFLISMGALFTYFLYEYEKGFVELSLLSQGDMKVMSGDLLKAKPVEHKK